MIEQALPQIEAKANELLDRLSGSQMTVRFVTQREMKTRDELKEALDIQISDGAGTRDYEGFFKGVEECNRVNVISGGSQPGAQRMRLGPCCRPVLPPCTTNHTCYLRTAVNPTGRTLIQILVHVHESGLVWMVMTERPLRRAS